MSVWTFKPMITSGIHQRAVFLTNKDSFSRQNGCKNEEINWEYFVILCRIIIVAVPY